MTNRARRIISRAAYSNSLHSAVLGPMDRAKLGAKRLCAECALRFFDLNHDPIHCPKCQAIFVVPILPTRPPKYPRTFPNAGFAPAAAVVAGAADDDAAADDLAVDEEEEDKAGEAAHHLLLDDDDGDAEPKTEGVVVPDDLREIDG